MGVAGEAGAGAVVGVVVVVAEHRQTLLLVLFKLVDALGYRLPVVRTELLGSINHTGRPTRRSRLATALIIATTAITAIANTTAANVASATTRATVAARNLGVGADGKQPIIATTRSDRIVAATAVIAATAASRPIRGSQGRVRRGPVLKPEIFAHRRSSGAGTGGTLLGLLLLLKAVAQVCWRRMVMMMLMERSHRRRRRHWMTADLMLMVQQVLLLLLLFVTRHEQDTFRIVTLRCPNARTVRNQLRAGTGTGQGGHAGGVARLRNVAHRPQPLERFRRRGALRAVVVGDAVTGGGQLLQVLLGPISGQEQFAVLTQSIEKRRRAGVRTGHVAVVALRLGVGRLLLVVVHLDGLLVVRSAVLLQAGLRQVAVRVVGVLVLLLHHHPRQSRCVVVR